MIKEQKQTEMIRGIGFTFLIAFVGYLLAKIPVFFHIGQMATAIIIAVLYGQLFGYPESLKKGIEFSSKKLLRVAIILYGLKLNMNVIFHEGLGLIVRDALVIIFAIAFTMWLAKLMKAHSTISFLLGVGTGICGAAAIASVAPIIKSKDEDTAISVGTIALIGTIFSIIYTLLRPILPLSVTDYGIWSGLSLHELAHVALAAAPAGEDALAFALLAKLGRVFFLIPLCFIIIYVMKRRNKRNHEEKATVEYPLFLIGFILLSFLNSYVFGPIIPIADQTIDLVSSIANWLLTAAMVGLGLNVNLKDFQEKALKPFLIICMTSLLLSILSYFII